MKKPIVWKAPTRKAAGIVLLLASAILSRPADAAPANSGNTIQGFYDALLSTMKNGRALGQGGRFARLEPVIRQTFDIPGMVRLSIGSSWAILTDAQRQQLTEGFRRYISAIYADRFDSYAGQKLQVTGEQPAATGVMVRSKIVKANGEPVKIDYMMRRNGDAWLISDVFLDGSISEVATRRSEFSAILRNEGIDGLITALNRKADMLIGGERADLAGGLTRPDLNQSRYARGWPISGVVLHDPSSQSTWLESLRKDLKVNCQRAVSRRCGRTLDPGGHSK